MEYNWFRDVLVSSPTKSMRKEEIFERTGRGSFLALLRKILKGRLFLPADRIEEILAKKIFTVDLPHYSDLTRCLAFYLVTFMLSESKEDSIAIRKEFFQLW